MQTNEAPLSVYSFNHIVKQNNITKQKRKEGGIVSSPYFSKWKKPKVEQNPIDLSSISSYNCQVY